MAAADDDDSGRPDLARYYTQKIKWGTCKGDTEAMAEATGGAEDVRCGHVSVPLDYADPDAGDVDVAMIRMKSSASGKPRGSLLLNFGGPGGPGVSALAGAQKDFGFLSKDYDVVSFDPRGVGLSEPVSCGDADRSTDPSSGGTGDAAAVLAEMRKVAAECAKKSGPVLPHMGTVNVSRDLDVMRQALGDKKLNYLGFSYGTRLGAVYAAQFPKNVGRMVLDGVDTLTEPVAEQSLVTAEGRQTALDNFLTWCTGNAGCVFGTDSRSARKAIVRLIEDMDQMPLRSTDGAEFTGQDVVGVLGQALYSRQAWPALSQALGALLADGDPRALIRMSGGLGHRPTGQDVPADNMAAALMGVNCADDPDRPDAAHIEKEVGRLQKQFDDASPVFGKSMLMPVLLCFGRPPGTRYIRDDVRDVKTPELLLVGTRGDPATPYRWTEETARRLGPQAVVLDNKGDGHTGYLGSTCVQDKVNGFLLYGETPKNGESCAADDAG
ncbi:alpha/beta fold hydrolase [Streptomyces sp. SID335]|uniref:Alpha/beta hydrolase n=2 Tax=Streptomyces TaxID=1883 RepID=A0A5P2BMH5_STRVZ|nr:MULTISPECIES: alpha/beta hydrolase [unclassified Streptomyces]NEA03003.1 alpha/beta hydrolase [Streptomyces sp. SID10116]QES31662.1 alpha/beta hydrolase [Streptomyces venezuelae]MYY82875.1 alpha/beta fold hydrolase [Streptomyces sp. SID335]MYZ16633.1 alpha/beta fold hydrolase [Streptomyces sp. SID337]NDZ91948.1 alpha/beta hydrolase [Streptomyces sp. SID10115]